MNTAVSQREALIAWRVPAPAHVAGAGSAADAYGRADYLGNTTRPFLDVDFTIIIFFNVMGNIEHETSFWVSPSFKHQD